MINWDEYFLGICNAVSNNSKCLSRKIGAILTRDNIIISTGYNSPPRGIPSCSERMIIDPNMKAQFSEINVEPNPLICPRKQLGFQSGKGLDLCPTIHAEKNCLLSAARNGICTKDTTLYMNATVSPCTQCFGAIINAGIKEVVLLKYDRYDMSVMWIENNSNIKIREFVI